MKNRVGEVWTTNEGYKATILEHLDKSKVKILLSDNRSTIVEVYYNHLKNGKVRNPYHPSLFNIGYVGEGFEYPPSIDRKPSPCYSRWHGMMRRCYDAKKQTKQPFYIGCSVSEDWHCYSTYSIWYKENYKDYMLDWQVDKDIIKKGNKIYSSTNCDFVPYEVNNVILKQSKYRGDLPIGVSTTCKNKKNPYRSRFANKTLGCHKTIEEAFQTYRIVREAHIIKMAEKWKGKISDRVYQALINYKIEITD